MGDVLAPQAPDHAAVLGVGSSGVTLMLERPETLSESAGQRRTGRQGGFAEVRDAGVHLATRHCVPQRQQTAGELQQQQHSERTKRKAGENTMMERLDGDEGIE